MSPRCRRLALLVAVPAACLGQEAVAEAPASCDAGQGWWLGAWLKFESNCFSNLLQATWCCHLCCPTCGTSCNCFDAEFTVQRCCPARGPPPPAVGALVRALAARYADPISRAHLVGSATSGLGLRGEFVEVGVHRGKFARGLLDVLAEASAQPRTYWMTDVWQDFVGYERFYGTEAPHVGRLRSAAAAVEPHWPRVRLLQLNSTEAVRLFDDGSLDFVYIDARHDYCSTLLDIRLWWPKLRPGGLLAGDDYWDTADAACPDGSSAEGGVRRAFREFFADPAVVPEVADLFVFAHQWFALKGPRREMAASCTGLPPPSSPQGQGMVLEALDRVEEAANQWPCTLIDMKSSEID